MKNKKIIGAACLAVLAVYTAIMLLVVYPGGSKIKNYTDAKDGVVWVVSQHEGYYGTGSGFAIGKPGASVQYIVTNYHVVFDEDTGAKADSVMVFFSAAANRYMTAQIYAYNADKDVAVLKLPEPTTERKALSLRKMKDTDTSATYYALGYPALADVGVDYMKYDVNDIVTTSGMISRQSTVSETEVYLIDIAINHGNSGGPLVNAKGEVVGINTFGITSIDGTANYAVCIDELIRMVDPEYVKFSLAGEMETRNIVIIVLVAVVDLMLLAAGLYFLLSGSKTAGGAQAGTGAQGTGAQGMGAQGIGAQGMGGAYGGNMYSGAAGAQNDAFGVTTAAGTAQITVTGISGVQRGKSFTLNQSLTFGRDYRRCDVAFPTDTEGVSGMHCTLSWINGKVYIKDIGSSYGTFINKGREIEKNVDTELKIGDTFSLGSDKEKFILELR